MAIVDRAKTCTECLSQPRRVRKGKMFPLCDDCRPIITAKKWKIRKLKRELIEGSLVQFNVGDGSRIGYLLKMRETRADVQPIGAVGRVPDIEGVSINDLKKEPNPSRLWPTVEDFYKANRAKKPVVLVADPRSAALNEEVSRYFRERAGGKPFVQQTAPEPVVVKAELPKPVTPKSITPAEKKEKKPRGAAIIIGQSCGLWTVTAALGHSRFTATLAGSSETRTMYAAELRAAAEENK